MAPGTQRRRDARQIGVFDEMMADFGNRRPVAAAQARRPHHPHAGPDGAAQRADERLGSEHGTGQAVADADRQRFDRSIAFLDDVEMGVKRCHLEDLGKREPQLVGQGRKMGSADLVIAILDQMQIFDEQIGPAGLHANQRGDFLDGRRIRLAALRCRLGPPAARTWMIKRPGLGRNLLAHRHWVPLALGPAGP